MFEKQITSILNKLSDTKDLTTSNKSLVQQIEKNINKRTSDSLDSADTTLAIKENLEEVDRILSSPYTDKYAQISQKRFKKIIHQLINLKLTQSLNLNLQGITEIHLNYRIGDLLILPTKTKTAFLSDWMSRDIQKLHSAIEKVGNVIKITQGPRKHIGFFKNKVILFLPQDYSGFITIRNQSGRVYLTNLNSDCMVDLTSISGNTLLTNLHVKRLQADLNSGNIILNHCQAEDIHVNTRSGNITGSYLKVLNPDADTLFTSTSGNIKLISSLSNRLILNTKSGNITTKNLNEDKADISTVSGNIKLNNYNSNGKINSSSGKIRISLDKKFDKELRTRTRLSSIKIKIDEHLPIKFQAKGNLSTINLPLDAIIYDSDDYKSINGYLNDEAALPFLLLESNQGSIELKTTEQNKTD